MIPWLAEITREVLRDLRRRLPSLVLFDLFFKGLALALWAPATAWLIARIVSASGSPAVGNTEIVSFLVSPSGIFWMVVAGSTAIALLGAEYSGILWIGSGGGGGGRSLVARALWSVLRRLPRLLGLASLQLGAHLLLTAPFAALVGLVYRVFLSSYDLYYLVSVKPSVWWVAITLAGLLGTMALIANVALHLRLILALPVLVFEGYAPLPALARSARLMGPRPWRRGTLIVACGAVLALGPGALVLLFDALGRFVFTWLPEGSPLVTPTIILMMATSVIVSVALAFLGVTLHALLLMRLYSFSRRRAGEPRIVEPASVPGTPWPVWRAGWAAVTLGIAFGIWQLSTIHLEEHVEITAHRGSSLAAPENTLSALQSALDHGADWAEIDVQETADGAIVLLHDEDFVRLSGVGRKVWELTLAEIRELDVGTWFSPEFAGERVPTLREAIALVRGRMKLNIELKYNGHDQRLAESVVELLEEEQFADQVVITSLSFVGLGRVRELDPEIPIGFIVAKAIGDIVLLDGAVLSVSTSATRAPLVLAAQAAGKEFHVWTVNDPAEMARMIDLRVDNIITDRPAVLRRLLTERAEMSDEELILLKVRNWFHGSLW